MAQEQSPGNEFSRCLAELSHLPIVVSIFARLKKELSPQLKYHTAEHAADVMSETLRLALIEDRAGEDLEDLAIAAAFHDAGFLVRQDSNEEIGAEFAAQAMAEAGYSSSRIERVKAMILDTRLVETPAGRVQEPHEPLSCYLLDGDLGNLGRDDFFEKLALFEQETGAPRSVSLQMAHQLLATHRWFTEAAWQMRQDKKADNLQRLEQIMAAESIPLLVNTAS